MNRRSVLIGAAGLAACAHGSTDRTPAFLREVTIAAGGDSALKRARVLAWTGQGVVHANVTRTSDQRIEIGVNTAVEPFIAARSETWVLAQGPASARVLEFDPTGGWATVNGVRTPLPPQQLLHERQQFALYGLMRLLPLLDRGVELELESDQTDEPPVRYLLHVRHPLATPTTLKFDAAYNLVGAENIVADPENPDAPNIRQRIGFTGGIDGSRVRWPRRLSIRQIRDEIGPEGAGRTTIGVPYFDLTLNTFTPRRRF